MGQFLYATNWGSTNVSAFSVNSATGALTPVPDSPFSTATGPEGVITTDSCMPSLVSPGAQSIGPPGGMGTVSVSAMGNRSWTTTPTVPWISLNSAASATARWIVSFSVSRNDGTLPRVGAISLSGFVSQVIQRGAGTVQSFMDVPPDHPFFDYITLLSENRITLGCSSSPPRYCPEDETTRGQMAFIVRAKLRREDFSYSPDPYFDDVPAGLVFFKYVQKMKELCLTNGCATRLCPDRTTSRGEMAAFLIRARYGEIFSYSHGPYFSDVPATHIFFPYIQKMRESGITTGCADGMRYCVASPVTRGQMATFIIRGFFGLP